MLRTEATVEVLVQKPLKREKKSNKAKKYTCNLHKNAPARRKIFNLRDECWDRLGRTLNLEIKDDNDGFDVLMALGFIRNSYKALGGFRQCALRLVATEELTFLKHYPKLTGLIKDTGIG